MGNHISYKITACAAALLILTGCGPTVPLETVVTENTIIALEAPLTGASQPLHEIIPVSVLISAPLPVIAADVIIDYDPRIIAIQAVRTDISDFQFPVANIVETNSLQIAAATLAPGLRGTSRLATFSVELLEPGTTTLTIRPTSQLISGEQSLGFITQNLTLTVE